MSALKRVRCTTPGISRHRHGRGFTYLHPNGRPVRGHATRERIRSLAIPPAWEDVWICPNERRHLQAVGTDAAGRRQYLYHEDWRARRDREKFDRVLRLARRLPAMRRVCDRDIASRGLTRERVLAGAVRLLDLGFFRILPASEEEGLTSVTSRTRVVSAVVKDVADALGNTPAVCPASYVDPRVIDRFLDGETIALPRGRDLTDDRVRESVESRVLDLLEPEYRRRRAA